MLCSIKSPVPTVTTFEAQLVILELLEHNPIFTVGYRWAVRGVDESAWAVCAGRRR